MRTLTLDLALGLAFVMTFAASCGGEDSVGVTQGASGSDSSGGGTGTSSGSGPIADTSSGGSGGSGSVSADSSGAADTTTSTSEGGSSSESTTATEPCRVDEDCDDEEVCTADYCGAAGCTYDPINGQPAPAGQIDGDCQVILCLEGAQSPTNSDNDLPVDMNVCTDDLCDMGAPSNPNSPAGTACNADGLCDGMGTCSECISPDDCDQLPLDDDCQTRTCDANTCGQIFTDADTEIAAQVPGDCAVLVCDGAGGIVPQPDASDVLDDGLECTDDICDDGVPANDPLPPGTPCLAGICDGNGGCVGCIDPSDCAGVDTFCRTITCDEGVCGVDDTPANTPLPPADQQVGDCVVLVCDGMGNVVPSNDDADLPSEDGNDCTDEVCFEGVPDYPDFPIDTACGGGGAVCDGAGNCVGCNDDAQCGVAPQCFTAACVANQCENQVTAGVGCDDGLFCTGGDSCDAIGVCVGGSDPCVGPDGDSNCAESCDEVANNCGGDDPLNAACSDGLFCTANDVCDGNGTCNGGGNPCLVNLGDNDNDCTESCNEGTDNCTSADSNGSTCNDGAFCTTTDTCTNGVCGGSGNPCTANVGDNDNDCTESCNEANNNCTSNDTNGSTCNDGAFCTVTDTCTSGICGGTGNPCTANLGDNDNDCTEACNEGSNNCTSNDMNGSVCNDGAFCTLTDSCTNGVCGGTGNPCSGNVGDNDNDCSESCSEVANTCTANDPANSVCADGLFCTSNDRCNAGGVCVGGVNPCPGPDGDADCTETCNENSNNCSSDDPNGSACDVSCFIDGSCLNGGCVTVCP